MPISEYCKFSYDQKCRGSVKFPISSHFSIKQSYYSFFPPLYFPPGLYMYFDVCAVLLWPTLTFLIFLFLPSSTLSLTPLSPMHCGREQARKVKINYFQYFCFLANYLSHQIIIFYTFVSQQNTEVIQSFMSFDKIGYLFILES